VDSHVVQRVAVKGKEGKLIADNEGQVHEANQGTGIVYDRNLSTRIFTPVRYELPYSLILPNRNEASNLLVSVCHSASHIGFASTRVEPTFTQVKIVKEK